jgi:NTE family protein
MGLAHVGVIQELERRGIRPDIVVGTSMGSIVGGLYASGLDGKALEQAVMGMQWGRVFDPSPERSALSYRQKDQAVSFPVRASLALKNTALQLPEGAVPDQNLLLELRRLIPVQGSVDSFDRLPIPFRAVATDIETGSAVVLDRGELATAMRASMSVPGAFAPILRDGRLLVDGGMADNIPVDVARAMGADIVIVVATQGKLLPKDGIHSAVDVLGQTVTLLILANERAQLSTLGPQDVLIRIDTGMLGSADFTEGPKFFALGRRAAQQQAEALSRLPSPARAEAALTAAEPAVITGVRFENGSRLADQVLSQRITGMVGAPADPVRIAEALNSIYALGVFSRVDYGLEAAPSGGRTLVVRAEASKADAGRLRLGLSLGSDFNGVSAYAVSADYRSGPLDQRGSEVRTLATVGTEAGASIEYFHPLGVSQTWFSDVAVSVQKRNRGLYSPSGFRRSSYDLTQEMVGLYAGYQFGGYGEARLGLERGAGSQDLKAGASTAPNVNFEIGRLTGRLAVDTLDNPFFPTSGVRASLVWRDARRDLGGSSNYQTLELSSLGAMHLGNHAFMAGLSGGSFLSGDAPLEAGFQAGGLFSLSGYHPDEFLGQSYEVGRIIYRYRLSQNAAQLFQLPLYVGASVEAGQVWPRSEGLSRLTLSGSVYAAADTILGPLFLAYGRSDADRQSVYLFFGRPF